MKAFFSHNETTTSNRQKQVCCFCHCFLSFTPPALPKSVRLLNPEFALPGLNCAAIARPTVGVQSKLENCDWWLWLWLWLHVLLSMAVWLWQEIVPWPDQSRATVGLGIHSKLCHHLFWMSPYLIRYYVLIMEQVREYPMPPLA